MIKAIVYNSNTGFTKKYAEMLSEKIELPIFNIDDAKLNLKRNDEIIYLAWVKANVLTKFHSVNSYFTVKAVGAVGVYPPVDKANMEKFEGENNIETDNVFYLEGGIDYTKLNKVYAKLLEMVVKFDKSKLTNSGEVNVEDYERIEFLEKGGSRISDKQLNGIIEWYQKSSN